MTQATKDATERPYEFPDVVYLFEHGGIGGDAVWCEDDGSEEGAPATKYVKASDYDTLRARAEATADALEYLEIICADRISHRGMEELQEALTAFRKDFPKAKEES